MNSGRNTFPHSVKNDIKTYKKILEKLQLVKKMIIEEALYLVIDTFKSSIS